MMAQLPDGALTVVHGTLARKLCLWRNGVETVLDVPGLVESESGPWHSIQVIAAGSNEVLYIAGGGHLFAYKDGKV